MITLFFIIMLYHQKDRDGGLNAYWVLESPKFIRNFQPSRLLHPAQLLERLKH